MGSGLTISITLLVLQLVIGCGGASDSAPTDVPDEIQASIAEHCKHDDAGVVRGEFPDDPAHGNYKAHAQESMLIRCTANPKIGADANLSAYASFESEERLTEAIASISLPPAQYEELCVTDRAAFTTSFYGSVPLCKRLGGRFRTIRRPPIPSAVTRQTYTPASGTAGNLVFKPPHWSAGGTGGSDNVNDVVWRRWGPSAAFGTGTAGLRGPCATGGGPAEDCTGQAAYYQASARVRLDQARQCTDQGVTLRYFSRATFQVYMRPGNPFGSPSGWLERSYETKTFKGECTLFVGGPVSG